MYRRELGRHMLRAAAALGLRSVSRALVPGLGFARGGCAADALDGNDTQRGRGRGIAGYDVQSRSLLNASTADGKTVVIVGSGYGAAVTALRLTQRGIPVTMYEMGRMWNTPGPDGKVFCSLLEPDGRAMWFRDKTEAVVTHFGPLETALDIPRQAGALDVIGPPEMRVFCGRGVGGGSLVNLSAYILPLRDVLARALPSVDIDAMYGTYYPRAKRGLRASELPADLLDADCYQYSRVGIAAAEAAGISCSRVESGYDYDYLRREIAGEVPASALAGEASYGNNYGKQSLDKTYLAEALGTGLLTIHSLQQVLRMRREASGYVLDVREIDIDGSVIAEREVHCSHLFLGGGSMGTSELLVRARDTGDLPDLNDAVGTLWGPNSDIFLASDNPIWAPTGDLQAGLPSTTFRTVDGEGKSVFSMIIPLPVGFETWISFNLVMAENPEAGHFVYDSVTNKVELKWQAGQNDYSVKSARWVFDRIHARTGARYNSGLFGGPEIGDRATYHPVGGCPLGRATDDFGRLRPYDGLYVTDGSLVAVGLGANPSLTITALAERNIERILAEDFNA